MNNAEIADVLRALADKIDPKPEPAEDTDDVLDMLNAKGYPLRTSLHVMLRKWDEQDPTWPIKTSLARQATIYKIPVKLIHSAIRNDPELHARFKHWPESGYQ